MTPAESYRQLLESGEFEPDAGQAAAVEALERVFQKLVAAKAEPEKGFFSKLLSRNDTPPAPVRGLYLWGGVGRGKTWLMDVFFENLPFENKRRVHFHRYMRGIHESLRDLNDQQDPLAEIGKQQAKEFRVLCFDEFVVEDIGDAMILSGLLKALFENGVTLIATSNTAPDDLYKNGLQRDRFKPAIEWIKANTDVMLMSDGADFRLRTLDRDATYLVPTGADADARLTNTFAAVAGGEGEGPGTIEVLGRDIPYRRKAPGVLWFDFSALCEGPRSSSDYIDIAREVHTVMLSGIPVMNREQDNAARRFIELIDEFYDRSINLIVTADATPDQIYQGSRLEKPFERTTSRLIEMQSRDYLAREKKVG